MSSVKEYKCLNCKAGLEFHPPSQSWKCNYCFSEFTKEQLDAQYQQEEPQNTEMPELDSYKCTSCGAELIADDTTSATFCLYCKNPTIIKSRFSGKFKPKSVIPFRLTQEEAKEIYKKWIGKRRFAPSEFKEKREIDKVTGIYAPFWLFNCQAEGTIDGEGTRVSTWTVGDYRYTNTKHYRVLRSGSAEYHKVPVDASKKLDDKFMHLIEPYNYEDLKDFSMQYMSGFMAEKYDVEAYDAKVVLKERVKNYLEDRLRNTVNGYATYSVRNNEVNIAKSTEDYSMLPIYLLINKYKGKEHVFMVNGQTGKVVGDTPISFTKQLKFAGIVFLIVWIIAVVGGAFFV
jgi:DNA-directed RNA polymerase subunit RPC12/RpoP